jgi:hypothetical protein
MKKRTVMIFLVALVVCMTVSVVSAAPPSFTGTITGDMTLNVPADFADINAALDYLSDKRIADKVIVTIQVADGNYYYTSPVEVTHPEGDKIYIVGNPTNPEYCRLNFSDIDGSAIVATNGSTLGKIMGFLLYGDGISNPVKRGIYAYANSNIYCSNMIINNFWAGVFAQYDSSIYAYSVTSSNNTHGFGSAAGSYLVADNSDGSGNSSFSYYAYAGSSIHVFDSTGNSYSPSLNQVGNQNSIIFTQAY